MEEIDFTCLSNKQMNMIIKGYNRLKKKEKYKNNIIMLYHQVMKK